MDTNETPLTVSHELVVIGSSAGGVEALSLLMSTLPANFPAPIVLAQHLDPNRPSTLHTILQRRTSLPVVLVSSSEKLKPGSIYVIPSNYHVSIRDHSVEIHDNNSRHPRPSVDTLLSTAADWYGEHLIAVILTGSGADGSLGAIDVKNSGGTVIIQDPYTARHPSMPMSLPPTAVDFAVPLERIGALLYDLLTGGRLLPNDEKTDDTLKEILQQVNKQVDIDFRPYKTSTILRRIRQRMTITHCHTLHAYSDYLHNVPAEVKELVKVFLINVTEFFRDPEAFTYLKDEILPELLERAREQNCVLRFWTAGCSTGEEPYSLAMLLTDLLDAELPKWSVKIFATDLDEAAINFARRGIYSDHALREVPTSYRERFFEHVDHGYRISKPLRQMVIFGQQDLSRSAPFPRIDMVICRNILIYFTPELQDYVFNQFTFSLNANGYLFLGKTETMRPTQSFYTLVNKNWKVYRCTGNALPSVRKQSLTETTTSGLEGSIMNREGKNIAKHIYNPENGAKIPELEQLQHFNELLLRFLPIGIVIINHAYHILTMNGSARRLLGLYDVIIEQDFLHAVRGIPYQKMRAAIDSMFRERTSLTLNEIELDINAGGNGYFVNISITPLRLEPGQPDFGAITISDVTEQVHIRRQLETVQAEQSQLMNELGSANKRLSDVNKELIDANEELQVANEELVLTHEELQASIEEFETTNEELQATNEELETNNEEIQATNEELETTNDELRARTSELQQFMDTIGSEQVHLTEIVEFSPFSILVLRGAKFIIDAYHPYHAQHLEAHSIRGQPLENMLRVFWDETMSAHMLFLVQEVYRMETIQTFSISHKLSPTHTEDDPIEKTMHDFVYTVIPSHDVSGNVDGVIIYALDETEQHNNVRQYKKD